MGKIDNCYAGTYWWPDARDFKGACETANIEISDLAAEAFVDEELSSWMDGILDAQTDARTPSRCAADGRAKLEKAVSDERESIERFAAAYALRPRGSGS